MKKWLLLISRGVKWLSYGVFTIVLLYLFFAFLFAVIPINNYTNNNEKINEEKTETIYLLSNGIHLDFIFESDDLQAFYTDLEITQKHKFIAIGWGDKGFYLNTKTWDDLEFSTVFNALFLKSEAAMHLTRYQSLSKKAVKVKVSKTQLKSIINYCISSFKKSSGGEFIIIPDAAYFSNDNFYKAEGSYNCIKTCNEWVNIGLKKAKVKTAIWSPTDRGVLYQMSE